MQHKVAAYAEKELCDGKRQPKTQRHRGTRPNRHLVRQSRSLLRRVRGGARGGDKEKCSVMDDLILLYYEKVSAE